jgi:hypothetical protein
MRAKAPTATLCKYVSDNNIDLVLVQEPYVVAGKVCGFPMAFKLIYDQNCNQPKSAIVLVNSAICAIKLQTFTSDMISAVILNINQKELIFVSAYFSPNNDLNEELNNLQKLVDISTNKSIIISMDSNSHSQVWYDLNDDQRGEVLLDFMDRNNFILMNNNEDIPTFDNIRTKSSIDLTLVSEDLMNEMNSWEVKDIESMSDHKYIYFDINRRPERSQKQMTKIYNTRNANWDLFDQKIITVLNKMRIKFNNILNIQQLEHSLNQWSYELTKTCDLVFRRIGAKHKTTNKWWTQELSELRSRVNNFRRRYQRCRTNSRSELKNRYKEIKDKYKQMIMKTKITSWEAFVSESTKSNPWGLVYQISKNKTTSDLVSEIRAPDGKLVLNREDIASHLLNNLFPNDRPEIDSEHHREVRQYFHKEINTTNDSAFTELEVLTVINNQNHKKAPGEDGMSADIIKRINNKEPKFLTNIYNQCLKLNHFPKAWKTSIVKVIPKSGKKDYRDPGSYRPISLISVFGKILEKLIIQRINYFLRSKDLLNQNQFGFTEQKSTEIAIQKTVNFIKRAFDRKGFALVISFDISGAFNSCWWPKIMKQLIIKNCPKNLVNTVRSYFTDRKAKLWLLGLETEKSLSMGCPQGSSSGPGFWNVFFDDIFDISGGEDEQIIGFADDTNLLVQSQTIEVLELKTNKMLELIAKWAEENKLDFNANKTQLVLFTKNIKYNRPKVVFKGREIEINKSLKYLGLTIDSRLTWNEHINSVRTKSMQILFKLLPFCKRDFGLNSKALKTIYTGSILPIIGYGSSIWAEAIDKIHIKKSLETIQRRVGVRIARSYRTVSSDAINILCNLLPIDLWIKQKSTEYYIKYNISNHLFADLDLDIDLNIVQRPISVWSLRPYDRRKQIVTTNGITRNYVFISSKKTQTGVGAGIYGQINGQIFLKKLKIHNDCTGFQAVLFSTSEMIEIINKRHKGLEITIFINNTCAQALKDNSSTNYLINNIYNDWHRAIESNNNIKFNNSIPEELNDEYIKSKALAESAISSHNRIVFELMSISTAKRLVRNKVIDIWDQRWSETTMGAQTKKFFRNVRQRIKIEKQFVYDSKFSQILTGHGGLNAYLCRFGLRSDVYCDTCVGQVDDADHRVFNCSRYETERQQLINALQNNDKQWPIEHNILVSETIISYFIEFCKNII